MDESVKKPNFIFVGAQKAGTTSLYSILKKHPQIFLPDTKEIHYFDKNYDKNIDYYYSFFKNANKQQTAIGEITPNYMYDQYVPERLYQTFGENIKLIFILRNPADRAFSNYKMNIEKNNEKQSFKTAIQNDLIKIEKNEEYPVVFHYIKRGFYSEQIKRFLKYFNKKNMLFLLFEEDTIKNREKAFETIFNFIEVDSIPIPLNVKITPNVRYRSKKAERIMNSASFLNRIAKKIIPTKKLRTDIKYFLTKLNQKPSAKISELLEIKPFLIKEVYKDSIIELEQIINRDLSHWLK